MLRRYPPLRAVMFKPDSSSLAERLPNRAPPAESTSDSPKSKPRTCALRKPIALSMPISRTRSRIDMAMVLAATKRTAKSTAEQMPVISSCTLPSSPW